jgi:alpha-tubulin suppressor-like RCC1 family protein
MTRGDVAALGAFFYEQAHRKSPTVVAARTAGVMLGACLLFGGCQSFLLSDEATFADPKEADGGAPDAGTDTAGCQGCAETEVCNEQTRQCIPACEADECFFGGTCFKEGAEQPDNACLVCKPGSDRRGWASKTNGTDCDNGDFCTDHDYCENGDCVAGPRHNCNDGLDCTFDDRCSSETAACEAMVKENFCVIGGTCVGGEQINPDQICQACVPKTNSRAYSARERTPCDDGLTCTKDDECATTGVCAGMPVPGSRCPAGYCDEGGRCGGDLVAAGASHSCVLWKGELFCFGRNHRGQLGKPTMNEQLSPGPVGTDSDWSKVVAGDAHTCGRRGGAIYCWGDDQHGQLGNGKGEELWLSTPQRVGTGEDWGALAAGGDHTCAIRQGALYCWGRNTQGQLGDGTNVDRHAPTRVGMDEDWSAVTAGYQHTCGLRGVALYCWGYNLYGQLGDGTTRDHQAPVHVVDPAEAWSGISAGDNHTCGLWSGSLFCWGSNAHGQLRLTNMEKALKPTAIGETLETIVCGGAHTCGTRLGGQLLCWGQLADGLMANGATPRDMGSMWTGLSSGRDHACGVQEGKFGCWGKNDSGQLGDGTKMDQSKPVDVILPP